MVEVNLFAEAPRNRDAENVTENLTGLLIHWSVANRNPGEIESPETSEDESMSVSETSSGRAFREMINPEALAPSPNTSRQSNSYNIDERDENGASPLHRAVKNGSFGWVEWLIDHGADVNAQDNEGSTPLHLVAEGQDQNIARLLASRARSDLPNNDGQIPLHIAAGSANTEVLATILNATSNKNMPDNSGDTPLHIAATDPYILEPRIPMLVDAGASLESENNEGQTPLHIAVARRRVDNIQTLIRLGAPINAMNKGGATPLVWLTYTFGEFLQSTVGRVVISPNKRLQQIMDMLLDAGADVTIRENSGLSAFNLAAHYLKRGLEENCFRREPDGTPTRRGALGSSTKLPIEIRNNWLTIINNLMYYEMRAYRRSG